MENQKPTTVSRSVSRHSKPGIGIIVDEINASSERLAETVDRFSSEKIPILLGIDEADSLVRRQLQSTEATCIDITEPNSDPEAKLTAAAKHQGLPGLIMHPDPTSDGQLDYEASVETYYNAAGYSITGHLTDQNVATTHVAVVIASEHDSHDLASFARSATSHVDELVVIDDTDQTDISPLASGLPTTTLDCTAGESALMVAFEALTRRYPSCRTVTLAGSDSPEEILSAVPEMIETVVETDKDLLVGRIVDSSAETESSIGGRLSNFLQGGSNEQTDSQPASSIKTGVQVLTPTAIRTLESALKSTTSRQQLIETAIQQNLDVGIHEYTPEPFEEPDLNRPAIGLVATNREITTSTIVDRVLEANQRDHHVLVAAETTDTELLSQLRSSDISVIEIADDEEVDLKREFRMTGQELGVPGVLVHSDLSTELVYEECYETFEKSDDYVVPAQGSSELTETELTDQDVQMTETNPGAADKASATSEAVNRTDFSTGEALAGEGILSNLYSTIAGYITMRPRTAVGFFTVGVAGLAYLNTQVTFIAVPQQRILLKGLLTLVAGITFLWGLERYRTRFVKTDLLIGITVSVGVLLTVYAPMFYDWLGALLNLQQRIVTITVLSNISLLLLVLYFGLIVQRTEQELTELTRNLSIQQSSSDSGTSRQTIYIVIPAYNEAKTISAVVDALPDQIRGHEVVALVVSDGSTDETVSVVERRGSNVVEHPINQGQGGALKTGFEVALQNDADIVVTMDADGQHPAEELERLVAPIMANEADFVMGSRQLGQDYSGNGIVRRAGIRTFTFVINMLTKALITDCTNGYRAIRGSDLEKLTLTEERFSAPELIIEARKNGLRIKEIPMVIHEREAGETKKPQLGYAIGLMRTILTTWIR